MHPVPFYEQSFEKQKGPRASYQSLFRFRKINLLVVYHLANFGDLKQGGFCQILVGCLQTFLTCFWLNTGDWKLVPCPFVIYLNNIIMRSGHFSPFQKNEMPESWHNWLLSNWSRLLYRKGPGTKPQPSKLFKSFLKIITLLYIINRPSLVT